MFCMYHNMFSIAQELHQIEKEIVQTPFLERVLKHILMMNIRNMIAATKIFTKCNTNVTFRVFAYHIYKLIKFPHGHFPLVICTLIQSTLFTESLYFPYTKYFKLIADHPWFQSQNDVPSQVVYLRIM